MQCTHTSVSYYHGAVAMITSAKEVMFSSPLVCMFAFLSGLRKNYSTNFDKIQWKGGTWAMEETIRFWW